MSGAAYLRGRARDAAERQRVPEFERVRGAVARWVRAERIEQRANVSTVYHLIPRAAAGAYRQALGRAADAHGVALVISGPYLPFAFAAPVADVDG
jgi:hypothetical protein